MTKAVTKEMEARLRDRFNGLYGDIITAWVRHENLLAKKAAEKAKNSLH